MYKPVKLNNKTVEIVHPESKETLKYHNIWLRDHCRCELCYDHDTFQRKFNILDVSHEILWTRNKIEDQQLKIECKDKRCYS